MKSTSTIVKKAVILLPLFFTNVKGQQENQGDFLEPIGDIDELVVTAASKKLSDQVTALKSGTPLIDVPQSATVFSKEQIRDQGIDSIGEIIDYTPGVNTSQGEGHRDAVVFRGVRSTGSFFVDGIRDDVEYYRSLYNVEQVEILRGPSAIFFGRGGTGGVINRVMKKAEIGQKFTNFQSTVDTFGATTNQLDYNQAFNDKAAFRLNLHHDYLNNHRDLYDGQRIGLNPTLTYQFSPETTLRFSYEFADHDRFIDRGIPSDSNGRPVERLSGTTFGDSDLNLNDLEAHTFRLSIEHEINQNWKAQASAFYGTFDKVYSNFYPSDFNEVTNLVELEGYIDRVDRQNFVLSGDIVGEFETFGVEHKLTTGAEYIHTSSDQDRFNSVFDSNGMRRQTFSANGLSLNNGIVFSGGTQVDRAGYSAFADDTRVTIDVYSIFLQDEIALSEKLDLILGARFDSFDINVNNMDPAVAAADRVRSRTDEAISPRFGLVYKPVEQVSIYGAYSESFEPRSGEQFSDINGNNNVLDPNTFSNLEAGVKWDIKPGLNLTVAAFRIDQESPQVGAVAGTFDVIESEITGFEAQLNGNITDKWFFTTGYSYLEGDSATTGLRLRELPQHTFSVWNQYQITEKFGVGLGVIYQDEMFTTNNSLTDTVRAELPSYVRVDAAAYYKINDSFRVQLNVENLFDTEYFPNAHIADNITVGAPINLRLAVIGTF